jgi:hypothetical protein
LRQQRLGAVPRLRRYARSLVFEDPQSDDLVQNPLERALTHRHRFDQQRDMVVGLLSSVTVYLRKLDEGTDAAFRYEPQGELGMFCWVESGAGYALVGALPKEQLLALAESIYRQHPVAGAASAPAGASRRAAPRIGRCPKPPPPLAQSLAPPRCGDWPWCWCWASPPACHWL